MRKVLVVDDSRAMRALIASIVGQVPDCDVVEVSGGFDALKELPRASYDLVITDINMPDINGLELLSYIRNNPSFKDTPVLVVSTEGSDAQRKKTEALGANGYVCKPFEPKDLQTAVENLLNKS